MVITMAVMDVMQTTIYQVVYMIAMGNSFVTAVRAVNMTVTTLYRRTTIGVCFADFNCVFVIMITVRVMKVAIVNIVYVVVVAYRRMAAI